MIPGETKEGPGNFQEFALAILSYWERLGCVISQPYDAPMGAGTFHPHTFLRGIGPEPWRTAYVQPCRRPADGRYGNSPYRFQHYYQLQVLLKPAPANIIDLFLQSLQSVGIRLSENDISLLEDDWKGPTLGAWGLGWEVRANGQEVTQFTYFQQLGGLDVDVVCGEITYGLERLFMYAKGLTSAWDIPYNEFFTYGDIFRQNEREFSAFNFKQAPVDELFALFDACERNVGRLCEQQLVLPAYDYVLQASHTFNLLDARGAISVTERQRYIGRVRECARKCALLYRAERERLGFPMLARMSTDPRAAWDKSGRPLPLPVLGEPQPPAVIPTKATCEIVLELGAEEMPSDFLLAANDALTASWKAFIDELLTRYVKDPVFCQRLQAADVRILTSSRRLAIRAAGLPSVEPEEHLEVWGPAERVAFDGQGQLSPAGLGFCRKNQIAPESVTTRVKDGTKFLFAERHIRPQGMPALVSTQFAKAVSLLPAALKMRWLTADTGTVFIRPVRWILALVDETVIPLEMFGLRAGRTTYGQRVLASEPFDVARAQDYEPSLKKVFVEPDLRSRREKILSEATRLAATQGGVIRPDEKLLNKLSCLSESPTPFLGRIDPRFQSLPARLTISVLREHMSYLAVQDSAGALLPFYVGVAAYRCAGFEKMVTNTQTVVSGRLEDGEFYYETDLKTPLAEFREGLKNQLFQAKMGTLWDKTERTCALVEKIFDRLVETDQSRARFLSATPEASSLDTDLKGAEWTSAYKTLLASSARFCKADLRSGCVQEFPDEMQGFMGGILIRHQKPFGAHSDLAGQAVAEHYQPAGAADELPGSTAGRLLALADKLDSLALMIAHGEDVKGNKDPLGLRRLAIGVLRLLGASRETQLFSDLRVQDVLSLALENVAAHGTKVTTEASDKLALFLSGRLKAQWRSEFNPGAVEAVCARLASYSILHARDFIESLHDALEKTGPESLLGALSPYRRCRNITTENAAKGIGGVQVSEASLQTSHEKELFRRLELAEREAQAALLERDYPRLLLVLAGLGAPLAAFFESTLVNDSDPAVRAVRISLLQRIQRIYDDAADFSLIQVS